MGRVHPLLVEAVRVAVRAAAAPTAWCTRCWAGPGDARLRPGLPRTPGGRDPPTDSPAPASDAWRSIELGEARIRIPAGTALDLGATGEGLGRRPGRAGLEQELGEPALVSLGGDIAISAPTAPRGG